MNKIFLVSSIDCYKDKRLRSSLKTEIRRLFFDIDKSTSTINDVFSNAITVARNLNEKLTGHVFL